MLSNALPEKNGDVTPYGDGINLIGMREEDNVIYSFVVHTRHFYFGSWWIVNTDTSFVGTCYYYRFVQVLANLYSGYQLYGS